jgi:hypothetical protein
VKQVLNRFSRGVGGRFSIPVAQIQQIPNSPFYAVHQGVSCMLRIPRAVLGGFRNSEASCEVHALSLAGEPPGPIGRRTIRSLTTAKRESVASADVRKAAPRKRQGDDRGPSCIATAGARSGKITGGRLNGERTGNLTLLPKLPHLSVSGFDMTPVSIRIEQGMSQAILL